MYHARLYWFKNITKNNFKLIQYAYELTFN